MPGNPAAHRDPRPRQLSEKARRGSRVPAPCRGPWRPDVCACGALPHVWRARLDSGGRYYGGGHERLPAASVIDKHGGCSARICQGPRLTQARRSRLQSREPAEWKPPACPCQSTPKTLPYAPARGTAPRRGTRPHAAAQFGQALRDRPIALEASAHQRRNVLRASVLTIRVALELAAFERVPGLKKRAAAPALLEQSAQTSRRQTKLGSEFERSCQSQFWTLIPLRLGEDGPAGWGEGVEFDWGDRYGSKLETYKGRRYLFRGRLHIALTPSSMAFFLRGMGSRFIFGQLRDQSLADQNHCVCVCKRQEPQSGVIPPVCASGQTYGERERTSR